MTELPDDVREFLGNIARNNFEGRESAKRLLARYPKPQPEWQPGDVVIDNAGLTLMRNDDNIWVPPSADKGLFGDEHIPLLLSADLIARAGRRVYPARFTEHHAPFLRQHDPNSSINVQNQAEIDQGRRWSEEAQADQSEGRQGHGPVGQGERGQSGRGQQACAQEGGR
jgi:hypothetical protein